MNLAVGKTVDIIGGGLCGRLMGVLLLQKGWRVRLRDPHALERPPGAGTAAALIAGGMLSPVLELESAEKQILAWGRDSIGLWRQWLADWGIPEAFHARGSLAVAFEPEADLFRDFCRRVAFKAGGTPFRLLQSPELRMMAPTLNHRLQLALHVPDEAHLDNQAVMEALAARLRSDAAFDFIPEAASLERLHSLAAESMVIDCRGAGAVGDCGAVKGQTDGLRAVRGEIIRVKFPGHGLSMPVRVVHPRFPIYIVPKGQDMLTVGATSIESAAETPVTVRSALELLSALYAAIPGSGEATITALDSGLRGAYPGQLPLIRRWGRTGYTLNGFYRHGFLLAPVFCEALAETIDRGKPLAGSALGSHFQEVI